MSRPQLSLKKLLTQSTSQVFPSLKETFATMKNYTQFQNHLIDKMTQAQQNKKLFQEQTKSLREKFGDTFQLLNKQIQDDLKLLSQNVKKQANRSKSVMIDRQLHKGKKRGPKKRVKNVSLIKQNLESKSTQKRDSPTYILNQHERSVQQINNFQIRKQNKDNIQIEEKQIQYRQCEFLNKNLTLISKKDKQSIEIYCCFICYKNDQKDFIWQKQKYYLAHLKQVHQIIPEFGNLLEIFQDQIQLTHTIFKGKLVNLFKNRMNKSFLQTFYFLHKKRYDQLYFCGCKGRRTNKIRIFTTEQQFYEHLKQDHNWKSNSNTMSHLYTNRNQFVSISRNKQFLFQQIQQLFSIEISKVKTLFQKTISDFSYQHLISFNFLNSLQLISCKKLNQKLTIDQLYLPVPYCQRCDLFTKNWASMMSHKANYYCKGSCRDFSIEMIKRFQQRTVGYKTIRFPQLVNKDIPLDEIQLLKAQCLIMKSSDTTIKFPFICAECNLSFKAIKNRKRDFLKHIYFSHSEINPLNTYQLNFLIENNTLPKEVSLQ